MSDIFAFCTHGVSVIPEYTREYTNTDNGLYMRRTGYGTLIKQRPGTTNWFHFPIPSAWMLDDDLVDQCSAYISYRINTGAVIREVNIHAERGSDSPRIWESGPITLTGRTERRNFNFSDRLSRGPLVISVFVEFEDTDGEVIFTGAGAVFEEH